ncbi:MAG: N-acetylglucosamine kinase [Anaerolineae bacterium]
MAREGFVVGVDGGGTKTRALVGDAEGDVLGRGEAGPSNVQAVGVAATRAALDAAVAAALDDAGLRGAPRALCLGMAGAGRAADRAIIEHWAAARFPEAAVRVVHDGRLVLAAGTSEGWGIAVLCGTGSLVYGMDPYGTEARAGGWGYLLGDEGSGYALGRAALRAVARAADGRGPATALTTAVLAHWSLDGPEALIEHVYRPPLPRAAIAELAPLVIAAAEAGDGVAGALVREAGEALADAVRAVVGQLAFPDPIPCALAGSVIVRARSIRRALLNAVSRLSLAPVASVEEPARGALQLALTI